MKVTDSRGVGAFEERSRGTSGQGIVPIVRERRGLWWLGVGLVALGVGLAVNAVLGPFVADQIDYPVSESMRNQTIGLDAVALIVVAPFSVLVGVLAMRGDRAAAVLALGPTSYAAYMFVQYIAGPDHLAYPRVLVLQLAVFAGGWMLAGAAWRLRPVDTGGVLAPWHGYVSWVLAVFVLARYVPGLLGSLAAEPLPAEAAADPAMYWLIVLLDLGIYVPVAVLVGVGLRRQRRWATTLHRGVVGWFTLTTLAVAAMAAAMNFNDDPYASVGQLILFLIVGVVIVAYGWVIYRPLYRSMQPVFPTRTA